MSAETESRPNEGFLCLSEQVSPITTDIDTIGTRHAPLATTASDLGLRSNRELVTSYPKRQDNRSTLQLKTYRSLDGQQIVAHTVVNTSYPQQNPDVGEASCVIRTITLRPAPFSNRWWVQGSDLIIIRKDDSRFAQLDPDTALFEGQRLINRYQELLLKESIS